jgi:hypothetical protein
MNKKRKKFKKPLPLIHPTQIELANMVAKARKESEEALLRVHIIGGNLQAIIDEANVTNSMVPYIKPQSSEGLINVWSSVANQASKLNVDLGNIQPTTDAVSSTTTVSTTIISGSYLNSGLYVDDSEFQSAWKPYLEFVSRPSQKDDVVQLLKEFGLDIPHMPNQKSSLELFETAHISFAKPVTQNDPVSTSLIPLRGSIENTIQSLILMRPHQEETRGWKKKIISIGKQLKKDSLPDDVIDELAEECHSLIDDLSGFKTGDIEREGWLIWLNRGTSFLNSLLKGLDSSKLIRRGSSSLKSTQS